jgi:hypothetical protein
MSLASPDSDSSPAAKRQAPRTHLFVIATLCSDSGSAPAHIRNLSERGALVEAAALPAPGTPVLLKRGRLEVRGSVAWKSSRQAGIAFQSRVDVGDWMARQGGPHQERVDELMTALRSSAPEPIERDSDHSSARRKAIESELSALRSELTRLGEGLTADIIMVATHPELQLLDIALQRVDRIAAGLKEPPARPSPACASGGRRTG